MRSVLETSAFKILDTKYVENDILLASEIASSFIEEFPDLVGLMATNSETTAGIGNAIKKANTSIIGVGFDSSKEINELMRQGYLKATILQNPYTMGYLGMAECIAALKGFDTGPKFLDTGITEKIRPR